MQLNISTAMNPQLFWAFAVDTSRSLRPARRQPMNQTDVQHFYITACSRQAKALGVKVGMHYNEAKALIPNMRIIVCNR